MEDAVGFSEGGAAELLRRPALAIQRHECSFVPSLGEAHWVHLWGMRRGWQIALQLSLLFLLFRRRRTVIARPRNIESCFALIAIIASPLWNMTTPFSSERPLLLRRIWASTAPGGPNKLMRSSRLTAKGRLPTSISGGPVVVRIALAVVSRTLTILAALPVPHVSRCGGSRPRVLPAARERCHRVVCRVYSYHPRLLFEPSNGANTLCCSRHLCTFVACAF